MASGFGVARAELTAKTRQRNRNKDLRDSLIHYLAAHKWFSDGELAKAFDITPSAVSHLKNLMARRLAEGDPILTANLQDLAARLEDFVNLKAAGPEAEADEDTRKDIAAHVRGLVPLPPVETRAPSKKQTDKSLRTRTDLIVATLYCLYKYGYHGATLARILEEAGVSTGSWRHQFDSKTALVAAAAKAMYAGTAGKVRLFYPTLADSPDPVMDLFDFAWENFHQGWHRDVWLEFTVAARTDPDLEQRVAPVVMEFFALLRDISRRYITTNHPGEIPMETLLNIGLYMSRGMAIQSIVYAAPTEYAEIRQLWRHIMAPYLEFKD